jgi:hypothetical protein
MAPICCICNENTIEYFNRCHTCKKSVCSLCYTKITKDVDESGKLVYPCPFCKTEKYFNIFEFDNNRLFHYMNNKYVKQNDIIIKLSKHITELEEERNIYNEHHESTVNNIIQNTRKPSLYNIFFKEQSKKLKISNPEMKPQIKMKEIAKLWRISQTIL